MKKVLAISLFALMFFALAGVASAKVERVVGWELGAPTEITFTCGSGEYVHMLDDITQDSDNNLVGSGHYVPNSGYTWNLTGQINGNEINFTIVYTGINSGYTLNMDGIIETDGSISGIADGNCQAFSMDVESAERFTGNHGQYVRSQEGKREAAQSRIGMPVQSKGHTK